MDVERRMVIIDIIGVLKGWLVSGCSDARHRRCDFEFEIFFGGENSSKGIRVECLNISDQVLQLEVYMNALIKDSCLLYI